MDLLSANVPEFVSVREFRRLTGLSRGLAYRLLRDGELYAVRFGRRGGLRVPRRELLRFLEAHRYNPSGLASEGAP